jgi:hypothetical protein
MQPTFDSDGYPTNETLDAIKNWPYTDYRGLIEYLRDAWKWPCYFRVNNNGWIKASTGGWSGNESLIGAMQQNFIFWCDCFYCHYTGGHYTLKIPKRKK